MRTVIAPLMACLATTACVTSAAPKTETVSGQLVDLACYMLDKSNTATTHRGRGYACAQACAKEGFQVAVLTSDGKVYQVAGGLAANKNAKLAPHLGQAVSITGEVGEKNGIALITSDDLQAAKGMTSGHE
jgi:hypothetical protein